MLVRKIRPEETVEASLVSTVAFLGRENEDYKERLANPLEHSGGYENTYAAFDDKGRIASRLEVHDFQVSFDGNVVGMGGVGGVATLPDRRMGGGIRRIFELSLRDMYEEGKTFSYLYPFSFKFYRKFGYEICNASNIISMPLGPFKKYRYPSGLDMFRPGDGLAGYEAVYKKFIEGKNLSVVRNEESWKRFAGKDPYTSRVYSYLHGLGDAPDAYLIYKTADFNAEGNEIKTVELAWTDFGGLTAMFGLVGGLTAEMIRIWFAAPRSFNIYAFFDEFYEIENRREPFGMNRIVNAKRALSMMKTPGYAGRAKIKISDGIVTENDGTFELEWDGRGGSEARKTQDAPDIETDIGTLTQLAVGFLTPTEAAGSGRAIIYGNTDTLSSLFTLKDLYMKETF